MSPLIAIAITTGILSAVWGGLAAALGLISVTVQPDQLTGKK